jgi:hypothetical protein
MDLQFCDQSDALESIQGQTPDVLALHAFAVAARPTS